MFNFDKAMLTERWYLEQLEPMRKEYNVDEREEL